MSAKRTRDEAAAEAPAFSAEAARAALAERVRNITTEEVTAAVAPYGGLDALQPDQVHFAVVLYVCDALEAEGVIMFPEGGAAAATEEELLAGLRDGGHVSASQMEFVHRHFLPDVPAEVLGLVDAPEGPDDPLVGESDQPAENAD